MTYVKIRFFSLIRFVSGMFAFAQMKQTITIRMKNQFSEYVGNCLMFLIFHFIRASIAHSHYIENVENTQRLRNFLCECKTIIIILRNDKMINESHKKTVRLTIITNHMLIRCVRSALPYRESGNDCVIVARELHILLFK